jgi:hypothetical protein
MLRRVFIKLVVSAKKLSLTEKSLLSVFIANVIIPLASLGVFTDMCISGAIFFSLILCLNIPLFLNRKKSNDIFLDRQNQNIERYANKKIADEQALALTERLQRIILEQELYNAGRELDPMVRYPEYDPVTDVLAYLGTNLPYMNFANIQVNSPLTLTKWWRMNNNVGFYYNKELRPYLDKTYSIAVVNYTINGSQIFSLKDWLLDVSYSYESKGGNSLYISKPIYGIDFGMEKAWLKNRINSKLTLYDAFDNIKRRLVFREKSIINNDFYHYFSSQRLVFSLTYNFGRSTFKAKESKKSGEESRAN